MYEWKITTEGLSLRDYFAGQALAGLSSIADLSEPKITRWAYEIADDMIEEGKKPSKRRA